jgi:hypothetical protein
MASNIITAAATEACTHLGKITLGQPDATLQIGGNAVYTEAALSGAAIACPNTNAPCTLASDAGSTLLKVNGSPVLLADQLKTGPAAPASLAATVVGSPTFVTTL